MADESKFFLPLSMKSVCALLLLPAALALVPVFKPSHYEDAPGTMIVGGSNADIKDFQYQVGGCISFI